MRVLFRWLKRLVLGVALLVVLFLLPAGYVEAACRGEGAPVEYAPMIADPEWQRAESRTLMRLSDVAPAAVVPFPGQSLLADLPTEAAILGFNDVALSLANRPGLARDLYGAGAWLVLSAGLTGCLPLTKPQRAALAAG